MSQPEKSSRIAVLLFTDIVDSVGLQMRLGGDAYGRLLRLHDQLFRQALQGVGDGVVCNDTGDGFLAEFKTAAGAVNAALVFQVLLRKMKWEKESPQVRIGIHQGHIEEIHADTEPRVRIVGMTANIAARVMDLAEAKQILLTRPVHDDARQFVRQHPVDGSSNSPPLPVRWKAHGKYSVKGIDVPIEVYEVGAVGFAPFSQPPGSINAPSAPPTLERSGLLVSKWRPAIGAALAALCGLLLWGTRLGDPWENASYDYLFLFGSRAPTNKVVLVLLDEESFRELNPDRDLVRNRALHTQLLNKLADDQSSLVVFDILFESTGNAETNRALADAMRRHGNVVLMAGVTDPKDSNLEQASVTLPQTIFLEAASNHCGIGKVYAETLKTPRKLLEPGDGYIHSLGWAAAEASGAKPTPEKNERWLRYYGKSGATEALSYSRALDKPPGYFKNKIVFIGGWPENTDPGSRADDKFLTPSTRWNGEAVGGVEIMAVTFLNLAYDDWLRRPAGWMEALFLVATGGLLGGGLCQLRRFWIAALFASAAAFGLMLAFVGLSYFTNYWFPWLVISGGQVPCALAWAWIAGSPRVAIFLEQFPGYVPVGEAFGEGAYGKVRLVRDVVGQLHALKEVTREKFEKDAYEPYDREFNGIRNYMPVSHQHPGLLQIFHANRNDRAGYFYYVMELADAQDPDWQKNGTVYKPCDLTSVCERAEARRLAVRECVSIGLALSEALSFLHEHGLVHRDIKPSNIIFVNRRPKLADVGLVRAPSLEASVVGTLNYMPPFPEPPGTPAADIYALGMVLYVISTGKKPRSFSELSTLLGDKPELMRLNQVICKACHPDLAQRYATAAAMRDALQEVQTGFEANPTR